MSFLALTTPAFASSVEVLSTRAVLEPSSGQIGDKDSCPVPTSSNADPEEATLQGKLVVTTTIASPNLLVADTNNPGQDTVDDLTLDEGSATDGAPVSSMTRDLDYLDGVDDDQLAPGTYYVYFNLDKTDYKQTYAFDGDDTTDGDCAGRSRVGEADRYAFTLRSGTTAVASGSLTTVMEGSAGTKQNDLDWLATRPSSVSIAVGDQFCIRSKYRQSSATTLYEMIGNAYYTAEVLRLDSVDLYFYDSGGADPGSIDAGIPGVDAPGMTPYQTFSDTIDFTPSILATLPLSSGDHWVSNFCFTVVGSGSTIFRPYWQTKASSTSNWKVDDGFGQLVVLKTAALTVDKVCDDSLTSVVAGVTTTVTHSIDVCNQGEGDAADVVVVDNLPDDPNVAFSSADNGGTYDATAGTITWDVGTVAAGDCTTLTFDLDVTADDTDTSIDTNVSVSAEGVSADNPTGAALSASDEESCPYDVLLPGLNVVKTATGYDDTDSDGVLSPGDTVHYSVEVSNVGDAALTGVVVDDDPDETYVDDVTNVSDGGSYDGDVISWTVGALDVGGSVTLTYDAVLLGAGTFPDGDTPVDNTACADSDETGQACDDETVTVTAGAVLTATKTATDVVGQRVDVDNAATVTSDTYQDVVATADTETVTSSTEITYAIVVTNTGNAAASNVAVRDPLDADATFVSAGGDVAATYDANTRTVHWDVGALAVGGSVTLELVVSTD